MRVARVFACNEEATARTFQPCVDGCEEMWGYVGFQRLLDVNNIHPFPLPSPTYFRFPALSLVTPYVSLSSIHHPNLYSNIR